MLRLHPYCVVVIPKNTLHRHIHEYLGDIPAPSGIVAKEALWELETLARYGAISNDDPVEKRLMILIALFECSEQPTADAFKKQLELVHTFNQKSPSH